MSSVVVLIFVCTAIAVFGPVSSVPMQQQQNQQQEEPEQEPQQEEGATGGFSTVVWSVLDDCFGGEDAPESAAVCLKYKALTALDRATSKPVVTISDGVSLVARAGKSLQIDRQTERADWAALDAAKDLDQKNALLDDMLASRVDTLMSTKRIVMDVPVDQEGRGKKKKKNKMMKKAVMAMGMMKAIVMGVMIMKLTGLIALKALMAGKLALILSLIMLVKKLMSQKQGGGGGGGGHSSSGGHSSGWESEPEPSHSYGSYGRSLDIDTHNMAYSGQKQ